MSEDLQNIDWGEELERFSRAAVKADAVASRSLWGRSAKDPKVRTSVVLRNHLAKWALDNGPRFSINLDPTNRRMRIMPNNEGGRFEAVEFKGVAMLRPGYISRLPNTTYPVSEVTVDVVEEKRSSFIVVTFPEDWLRGQQLLLPPPPKATSVEDGIPSGIRRVLNVLATNESTSHSYFPSVLEMSREDTRRWLDETKAWLAGLKPPVILVNKNNSYYISRPDAARVRKLLEG